MSLPPWPSTAPAHGAVVLRPFTDADAHLAVELGADPYVPLIGTLPAHPSDEQALDWVRRQVGRHADGTGFSFAIADAATGRAVGNAGLWLQQLAVGRATAGYAVAPLHRRMGFARDALAAMTAFAATIPELQRVELFIEPWNTGSIGVATAVGYRYEGVRERYQEIGGVRRDMLVYATAPG